MKRRSTFLSLTLLLMFVPICSQAQCAGELVDRGTFCQCTGDYWFTLACQGGVGKCQAVIPGMFCGTNGHGINCYVGSATGNCSAASTADVPPVHDLFRKSPIIEVSSNRTSCGSTAAFNNWLEQNTGKQLAWK
jgi:hypothetical protein